MLDVGEREGESGGKGTVSFMVAMLEVEAEISVSVSSPLEVSGGPFCVVPGLLGPWLRLL